MAELSDELLMAYADGALDPVDRAAVEAAIKQHPEYQQKLEKFRATLEPVQQALQEDLRTARLAPLIASIRRGDLRPPTSAADPHAERVLSLRGGQDRTRLPAVRQYSPIMMAASLALLIGGGLGWSLHTGGTRMPQALPGLVSFNNSGLLAQGPLEKLLETESSGTGVAAQAADGQAWQLKASFTFRSVSRSLCRRYEMNNEANGRFAGFACRSEDGRWYVHTHAKVDKKAPGAGGFAPAAGDDDAALEAAIRSVMEGDVFQSGQEAQMIASRWKSNHK